MTQWRSRAVDLAARRPGLVALGAGAVSATGFKPLGLWPVMLVCLAVLIQLLWQAQDRKAVFKVAYLFGFGQFTIGLKWIAHAFTFQDAMPHWLGWFAVPILSVYLAVYPAIGGLLGWTLGRGQPKLFATMLAASWLLTEYLRATMFTGFAWNPLGVIWLGTGVEQLATVIGTYGLGLVAMLAAGGLWWAAHGAWRPAAALAGGLLLIGLFGWYSVVMIDGHASDGYNVLVVQPNINQNEKYDPQLEQLNFRRLAELTGKPSGQPRLIFWPEAAVPAILDMEPAWRRRIASLLGPQDLLMLGGDKFHYAEKNGVVDTGELEGANNSLWVLNAQARLLGRYDKAHLVPYGEYLPMRPLLKAIGLSRLVPGDVDFWPGPGPRTLHVNSPDGRNGARVGVQLCYEIIFSGEVVDQKDRPDFLFNPSNDAWFGSWGPPQHLAQARLRAIEERLSVIRSTPTGISALVNPAGTVQQKIGLGEAGSFSGVAQFGSGPTLFSRGGNFIPLGLALLLLVSGVAIRGRSR